MRFKGSLSSIFWSRSIASSEISNSLNFISFSIIYRLRSSLSLDRNGKWPTNNPKSIIPKLQTSSLGVDSVCPSNISGAIYLSEPAWLFSGLLTEDAPKIPKSTIFNSISNSLKYLDILEGEDPFNASTSGFFANKIF